MPKTHNCRKKFTKKSLGEHNLVSHIVDSKTVYCICGNKIRLDKEWDPDFLIRHAKNNRCQEARKGRQAITKFFPVNDTKNTKKPCKGLRSDKIANYLECIGMLVVFGGSRPIKEIAKEIFPQSFENNNDSFHWDDFPIEAQEILREFSDKEAKWKNFPSTGN